DLKPCPFCGSAAQMMGGPAAQEWHSVWCTGPGCNSRMNGIMDAGETADKWNRRGGEAGAHKPWREIRACDIEWNVGVMGGGRKPQALYWLCARDCGEWSHLTLGQIADMGEYNWVR